MHLIESSLGITTIPSTKDYIPSSYGQQKNVHNFLYISEVGILNLYILNIKRFLKLISNIRLHLVKIFRGIIQSLL